jgi:uncharacterized membrane protein
MKKLSAFLILSLLYITVIQSQAYIINDYNIEIKLSEEGYFDVHEVISVTFNEDRRGIMRNVPKSFNTGGKRQKVKLTNVNVKSQESKILSEGNDYIIRIGNKNTYISGPQTYDISYRISNAFLYEEDHTAFQYNLISGWDTSIEKLSYSIALPDNTAINDDDFLIMTGKNGETKKHVSIKKSGNTITGRSLLPIPTEENVTVAMRLPLDSINKPPPPTPFYKKDKLWFLPLGFLFFFINFFKRSRQSTININNGTTIPEEHFPPSEFSPAMVGAYYDNKVNTEDVISLLPYWAEQGYLQIIKDTDELYFKKISELPQDLPEYQYLIFDNLFKNENMIMLSELKNKMYMHLHKSKSLIHKELLSKNLYDEDYLRIFRSPWMIVLGILFIIAAISIAILFQYFISSACLIILAVATFIMYAKEPKKSDLGIRIHRHLVGFKEFLVNSPQDTTQKLLDKHPKYFEHIYPYAIAFGIDKTWLNRMKELDINAPYWFIYHGAHGTYSQPTLDSFSKDFSIPEITSVFTSAPAPTGGASGGGFSGGGAGGGFGGGGGSW